MGEWPREIHGHVVNKKSDFLRASGTREDAKMQSTFHCVRCGIQVAGPDDPRLEETTCRGGSRDWQS